MRHVHIRRLADPLARPLLLRFCLCALSLVRLLGVLARGFLPDADELAVHVVEAGDGHAVPHDLELLLDAVVERFVVGPDVSRQVILFRTDDEDLVLALKVGECLLAVWPAVFEVLD